MSSTLATVSHSRARTAPSIRQKRPLSSSPLPTQPYLLPLRTSESPHRHERPPDTLYSSRSGWACLEGKSTD
eukprot:1360005-Amorphochlora_amoeboformis.AAC.2